MIGRLSQHIQKGLGGMSIDKHGFPVSPVTVFQSSKKLAAG